jgi:predicted site-specific integrase-resolvase
MDSHRAGAKYISRPKTFEARDRAGVVPARRTASGRRYGLRADLDRSLGTTAAERPRRTVCYGRVSSPAQRPDGKKQRLMVKEFVIAEGTCQP